MKAWKLKEDVRLFAIDGQTEVLRLKARNIIDFSPTFDAFASQQPQPSFAMKRRGMKSTFVRDHWDILGADSKAIGYIQETSSGLALVRRWIELIPFGGILGLILVFVAQTYSLILFTDAGEYTAATIIHKKNPVLVKMSLDSTAAPEWYNPLWGIAATSLLSILDATKN
jgi:hypothetical protein